MTGDRERRALDRRLIAWAQEARAGDGAADDVRFDALARDLFAFQYARCVPYRRLCQRRGVAPASLGSWREIPAVPTGAFKEMALRSFPCERTHHTFRTSGTAAGARGELHLDTLAVYEASLLPSFERHLLPDLAPDARMTFLVLGPNAQQAPDSSLAHMFDRVVHARGAAGSAFEPDPEAAARGLADAGEPLCLCGTAFAFVHLLDQLATRGTRLALPAGSRVMETGGFKGRSREVTRDALYAGIAERLGVPPERVVNQYGMTELASQFYDSVLLHPDEPRRKLSPPWARVRCVARDGGADVPDGELGILQILDLANTGSVLAVQTADLGRRLADGFEVLGRESGAEARGCSLAADEMLAGDAA